MGWWIALAVLVGLAILPLGVSVKYNADGVFLAVIAGPIRIRILPAKKKDKKPEKEKKSKKEKKPKKQKKTKDAPAEPAPGQKPAQPVQDPKPVSPAEPPDRPLEEKYPDLDRKPAVHKTLPTPTPDPEEKGGSWKDFLGMIPIVLDFLGDFRRKLRVNRLEMKLILAGDDPCDLAINYGRAWTALGNLLPMLERVFVIKKRDVEVECDFTASKTLVTARMDLTITLGRILAAVCKFALRALKEYLNIMKKRKGGASK